MIARPVPVADGRMTWRAVASRAKFVAGRDLFLLRQANKKIPRWANHAGAVTLNLLIGAGCLLSLLRVSEMILRKFACH